MLNFVLTFALFCFNSEPVFYGIFLNYFLPFVVIVEYLHNIFYVSGI